MGWRNDGYLKAILEENRTLIAEEKRETQLPTICPIDGAILIPRGDGAMNCPMGNFRVGGAGRRGGVARF